MARHPGAMRGVELVRQAERYRDGHITPGDRELRWLVEDLLIELNRFKGEAEATHKAHVATLRQFDNYRGQHK